MPKTLDWDCQNMISILIIVLSRNSIPLEINIQGLDQKAVQKALDLAGQNMILKELRLAYKENTA